MRNLRAKTARYEAYAIMCPYKWMFQILCRSFWIKEKFKQYFVLPCDKRLQLPKRRHRVNELFIATFVCPSFFSVNANSVEDKITDYYIGHTYDIINKYS
jgi:hypothetical protein